MAVHLARHALQVKNGIAVSLRWQRLITWVGGEQIFIRRVAWGCKELCMNIHLEPGKVIKFARRLSDNEPDMKLSLWAPDLEPGVYGSWHGTCPSSAHGIPVRGVQDRSETAEEYLEHPPADVYFAEHDVAIFWRARPLQAFG